MAFKILHKDKKTKARIGLIQTKKGPIETPLFMPVATKASVKYLSSEDLESMDANAIISNALVLHLKPGEKLIKKLGGLGKFMNYKGINVTDSGGFQMYSDKIFIDADEAGVFFKNHHTSEKVFISPEKDMQIQLDLDSEIAMCLDSMPLIKDSRKKVEDAVRKTVIWAERCKKHHNEMQERIPKQKRQLLFGIIQGGLHKDLRERCAKALIKMDFDGYSIGGLALGEPKQDEYNIVRFTKSLIPEEKPVYLMGAGDPIEILEAISRGIDMFDSRFPAQNARHGAIFTSEGKLRLFNSRYKDDQKPLDESCDCFVCKNYSRAYIRYQLKNQESTGMRLATYHNLYYLTKMMEDAKQAIKKGKFSQFKRKIMKLYAE